MKKISKNYFIFTFAVIISLFFCFGVAKANASYEPYLISPDFQITQTSNNPAPVKQISINDLSVGINNNLLQNFCACNVEGQNGIYSIAKLSQNRADCTLTTVFEAPAHGGILTDCYAENADYCGCKTNVGSDAVIELPKKVDTESGARGTITVERDLTDSWCSSKLNNINFDSCNIASYTAGNSCFCQTIEDSSIIEDQVELINFTDDSTKCNNTYINNFKPKVSVNNCVWVQTDAGTSGPPTQGFTEGNLSEIQAILNKPQLQIKIPGLSFSGEGIKAVEDETGARFFVVPFLGEYISAVYKFAVATGSVVAVVMIIVAGIQWTVSGGSQEGIGSAKKRIVASVIGLILLVGSYTLLYTINPNLVEFNGLKVKFVEGVDFTQYGQEDADSRLGVGLYANSLPGPTEGDPNLLSVNCAIETGTPSYAGVNASLLGKLSCSSGKTRGLKDIKYVIIHDGGSAESNVDYWMKLFVTKQKAVSSHYTINKDGIIYQLVDESRVAFHTPNWNTRSIGIDMQADPSAHSFYTYSGIGTCLKYHRDGKVTYKDKLYTTNRKDKETAIKECTPTFTQNQYTSLNALLSGITARTSVIKDNDHILGHCSSAGNHSDPRNFDWSKIGLTGKDSEYCEFFPNYENRVKELADQIFGS